MNGIIIIDKPAGITSHAVVQDVKKILGAKKVGHTGTLDPLATGVLPVCVNEGTKLAQFFNLDRKEYRATLLLGVTTDTYDVEGKIIAETNSCVDRADIARALLSLVGTRQQVPPPYSAVKYQGQPLYKWARKGINIVSLPRTIEIYHISLEEIALPYVTFSVACSKGTYIRSLCVEIGELLGCGACLAGLRRIQSGHYSEREAFSLAAVEEGEKKEALLQHLIPLADALPDLPVIPVDKPLAEKIRQGYQPVFDSLFPDHIPFLAAGDVLRLKQERQLVAIARMLSPSDSLPAIAGLERAVEILRVFNSE
ncbi:MAG: tRNA pseudouridine(55) synthase TruB [Deltaproteobacteria bacterium]|nr:tRNA pseudouridine(55) synthase TruB [Deltaproteobacteria bacterium]